AQHPELAGKVEAAVDAAYRAACADLLRPPTAFAALPIGLFLDEPGLARLLRELWAQREERGRAWAREAMDGGDAALSDDADEDAALGALVTEFEAPGADPGRRRRALDLALTWPTDRAIGVLLALCTEAWAQERAALVLTLRFGRAHGPDWSSWHRWLTQLRPDPAEALRPPPGALPVELAGLFWDSQGGYPEGRAALFEAAAGSPALPLPEEFIERWQEQLTARQRQALLGR